MEDIFVIKHIEKLCKQRGWTKYKLAKESGITHSSLNAMLKQPHIPTTNSLIKICKGFNISMTEFFAGIEGYSLTTPENKELNDLWTSLDNNSKKLSLTYMYGLARKKIPDHLIEGDSFDI